MITTLCSLCGQLLAQRPAKQSGTVRTVGSCCAGKVGLPAHACHPQQLRRAGDRRAA